MYGIVTFHDGFNFGAYLQVYALQNRLKELGLDNEIINYKNRKHWIEEYRCFLAVKDPVRLFSNIIKIFKFKKEQKKFKQSRFFNDPAKLDNGRYKAVFFGSDEIWNYENPLFGKDLFYFGKGFGEAKLISYAASFGSVKAAEPADKEAVGYIRQFHSVSVRDRNSLDILNKSAIINSGIVLDPTLIYDFSGKEIECKYDNFIMLYTTGLSLEMQQAVKDYAKRKGKKLISVGWMNRFCAINETAIGPFEFLGYVKKADEIITSMYHGTLFSIKYNKQFCLIVDPYRINKMSIVETLGLDNRICAGPESIEKVLGMPIDYENVNTILRAETAKAEKFLLAAVRS